MNLRFFKLLLGLSSCAVLEKAMLAIKLPNSQGTRSCLIKFFVLLRFGILILLVYTIYLFYRLVYDVVDYTFYSDIDLTA